MAKTVHIEKQNKHHGILRLFKEVGEACRSLENGPDGFLTYQERLAWERMVCKNAMALMNFDRRRFNYEKFFKMCTTSHNNYRSLLATWYKEYK